MLKSVKAALYDLISAYLLPHMWLQISLNEMKGRYKRTVLGPWWMSIGFASTIAGIGFVWSFLFNINLQEYYPYLASGIIVWVLISSSVVNGCDTFVSKGAYIKSIPIPLSTHILVLVANNFMEFFHNIIIVVCVVIIFDVSINYYTLLLIPALLILWVNILAATLFFGVVGARYRDFKYIVQYFMNVLAMVTPIMWKPDMLGGKRFIADYNPLTHYVDLVRLPMLGEPPTTNTWIVVGLGTVIASSIALSVYARYRHRVVLWL